MGAFLPCNSRTQHMVEPKRCDKIAMQSSVVQYRSAASQPTSADPKQLHNHFLEQSKVVAQRRLLTSQQNSKPQQSNLTTQPKTLALDRAAQIQAFQQCNPTVKHQGAPTHICAIAKASTVTHQSSLAVQPSKKANKQEVKCEECGSMGDLERDPTNPEVCYCVSCWEAWSATSHGSKRRKEKSRAKQGRWACGQCGSLDNLERDPTQMDVSYCRSCWNSWDSKSCSGVGNKFSHVEVSPKDTLEEMASKSQQVYKGLCHEGQEVWKVLKSCIQSALRAGVVHFEREFRNELEVQLLDDVEVARQAGSQWLVKVEGSCASMTCYASVRTEVLGGTNAGILAELKRTARVVKSTLLEDRATWLRQLMDSPSEKRKFFSDVMQNLQENYHDQRILDKARVRGLADEDNDLSDGRCPVCRKSKRQDLLGGKHMCRIIASFKCRSCCSKWTSHAGRYNLEERRVMGQRCQGCQQEGTLVGDWVLAGDIASNGIEKPHRSELCEACDMYGNCRGAFFDPFQMSVAVEALSGRPPYWNAHQCGHVWTTQAMGELIILQPHVHVCSR